MKKKRIPRVEYCLSKIARELRVAESTVREALATCGYPVFGDVVFLPDDHFPTPLYQEIRQVHAERQRALVRTGVHEEHPCPI